MRGHALDTRTDQMSFAALFARARKQGSATWLGGAVLAGGAVVLLLRRGKKKAIAPPRPLKPLSLIHISEPTRPY